MSGLPVAHRVRGAPSGRGLFWVDGDVVMWLRADDSTCTCAHHQREGSCVHVQAVANAVEIEARDPGAPTTAPGVS